MTNSYILLQMKCCISILSLTKFLVLSAIISATMAAMNPARNGNKLVLQLVHRDAIFRRPFNSNLNLTVSDFTNHIIYNMSLSLKDDDVRAPLIPDQEGATFLVNISIGDPQIPQLLAMDTGSSLTWVHHPSCPGCTPASSPIYDPDSSSTYKPLSCDNEFQCLNFIDSSDCRPESHVCKYTVSYLDGSVSKGNVALEKFTLVTSTGGEWGILDLVFGYGLENNGLFNRLNGILGLQLLNEHSLVSRMDKKFSYCTGNISDLDYAYNRLTLGEGAVIEGFSTPLRLWRGHYAVSLKGISVGKKQLSINQELFDFKVVIDSGTTLMLLEKGAYEEMRREVTGLLDGTLRRVIVNGDETRPCYWGDLSGDVMKGFPIVTLGLAEGAEMYLGVEGVFRRVGGNVFCMAVDLSRTGVNIIGAYAQQYYNIGFDLNAWRVSFMSIECALLDD